MNRVIVISGASRGLGLALAKKFVDAGDMVFGISRTRKYWPAAKKAVPSGHFKLIAGDITSEKTVKTLLAGIKRRAGRIDILINNAGAGRAGGTIVDQEEADWDWTFNICLKNAWLFMKQVLPGMVERGSGAIVNLSSLAGIRVAPNSSPAYAVAKAGVVQLTRFAAIQYAPYGIRINVVAPGLTATPAVMAALNEEEQSAIIRGLHAVPRLARPEETAAVIAFLCSDEAPIVTGLTVPVDGGWAAR